MSASELPGPLLIRTKLLAPVTRGTVERRAALALLVADDARRITLIRAPAGWGKSNLLSAWASESPRPFAWLSLDRYDTHPTRFFTYVIAALRSLADTVGERSGQILAAGGGLVDEVVPSLLDELAALPQPSVLVLDDYHVVGDTEVHEAVMYLIEHARDHLELALASRTEPPLPLARLRGRGELVEITADHLRFNAAEADALLNERQGLGLQAADVERLVERTEGWPAGLYLAALSLRGRDDAPAAVARFAGDDRHVVDYLTEEVLAGQPADVIEFLLDTCILDRLCASLCDAVTGRHDAAAMLRRIEASNLFLVPLDLQREWYRYHHLFADLLQLELRGRDITRAHRRAAAWHMGHRLVSEAVRHHVAAGEVAQAAQAIASQWLVALTTGGHDTVDRWLDALPEETVRSDARLAAARAMNCISTGRLEALDGWIAAVAHAQPAGPAYDGFASPAAAAMYFRVMHRWLIGDVGGTVTAAMAALGGDGPGAPWDAVTLTVSGAARYWNGDAGGRAEVVQALARARELGFHPPVISCLGILAVIHWLDGEPSSASRLADEAIEITEHHGLAEYWTSAPAHTVLGEVLLAQGRRDEALAELGRGLELARRGSGPLGIAAALVALAGAHPAPARRPLLSEARRLLDACPDPGPLALGQLAAAERRARTAARPAAVEGEPFSDRELEVLRMLAGPLTQREIGSELFISFNTVKSHTKAIYRKLGVADRRAALARGRELGML